MNDINKVLKDLWLKENEIKIYIASLTFWAQPASVLWKKTGISRSNTQYICTKLLNRWLLSIIETMIWNIYSPEEPEKLISMLNKEYNKLDRKIEKTHSIISDLKKLKNPYSNIPKVKYYNWTNWIIDMFEDILIDKKTIYWFIYLWKNLNSEILYYLKNNYIPRRKQLWIKAYEILNNLENENEIFVESQKVNRDIKLISKEKYPIHTCLQIYGNKVSFCSFIDWDITWIIIENINIAETNLSTFKAVWDSIK